MMMPLGFNGERREMRNVVLEFLGEEVDGEARYGPEWTARGGVVNTNCFIFY